MCAHVASCTAGAAPACAVPQASVHAAALPRIDCNHCWLVLLFARDAGLLLWRCSCVSHATRDTGLAQALGRAPGDTRKHTVLIDGSPLVYRAHFGIPNELTRKDGAVVTAVFGFTRLLLKLRSAIDADYVGVFLDDKRPTFRKEMFDDYKAHRKTLPNALKVQLDMVEEASTACGFRTLKVGGFEADDLIATV